MQSAIASAEDRAEWFLSFYDIFLRNAFGNYRDVSVSSLLLITPVNLISRSNIHSPFLDIKRDQL